MRLRSAREIILEGWQISLAAKCWGEDSLPPLLALHGWLDNAATFDKLAPLLSRFQVFAVDLPGHGKSERRSGIFPGSFHDWVAEVAAIVQRAKWKSYTLMGHSMGAGIASMLAGTFPEALQSLILLDGLSPLTSPPQSGPERLRQSIQVFLSGAGQRPRLLSSLQEAAALRQRANRLNAEAAQILVERGTKKDGAGYRWSSDPRLALPSFFRLAADQVLPFLKAIQCPVLLVQAKEGLLAKEVPHFQEMAHAIADLEREEVSGGHHVHLEHAEKVAPVIENWLDKKKLPT